MEAEAVGTCPVCFEDLKDKETASPDVCDHVFCLFCLQKWAKQGGSFCPVDRKRFGKIIDLSTSAPIQIKPRKRKKYKELYDVSVYCEVCSKANNGDTILLCDCCDLGYHCKCLTPPLKTIPPGVWHCPVCVAVSEKIKSKKGISKEVENIAMDHTNYWNSYSSDSNNSLDCRQKQNNKKSISKNNSKNKSSITVNSTSGNPGSSFTVYGMPGNSASQHCLRKPRKIRSLTKELSKVKNLRPRNRDIKYTIRSSCSSSESNDSVERFEKSLMKRNPSSSTTVCKVEIKLPPQRKNGRFSSKNYRSGHNNSVCNTSEEDYFQRNQREDNSSESSIGRKTLKRWHLRSRRLSKRVKRNDSSYSNSSENSSILDQKRKYSSNRKYKSYYNSSFESHNFTHSKHLDLTASENTSCAYVSDVITDSSCEREDTVNENTPNVNKTKCKKKNNSNEDLVNSVEVPFVQIERLPSAQEMLYVENKEKYVREETEIPQDKKTHNNSDSRKENLVYSKPNEDGEKLLGKNSLPENVLILDEITVSDPETLSSDEINHFSYTSKNIVLNKDQNMPIIEPIFSVFEKLEDTSVSQKKYSNINLAVTENFYNSKNDTQIIKNSEENSPPMLSPQYSDIHHSFKDNLNRQTDSHDLKIVNISKELKEIEREKWKSFHLRKNPKASSKILCCSMLDRNHPYMYSTVEVGKYCHHSKYSDNYNRFLSIAKSLRKKVRYDKYDSAIIPSLDIKRLIKKKHRRTLNDNTYTNKFCSVNPISLSSEKSLNLDFKNKEKHPSIPIETKELLRFKEAESELLCSVICLNDAHQLSVRNDGSLFVDWHCS